MIYSSHFPTLLHNYTVHIFPSCFYKPIYHVSLLICYFSSCWKQRGYFKTTEHWHHFKLRKLMVTQQYCKCVFPYSWAQIHKLLIYCKCLKILRDQEPDTQSTNIFMDPGMLKFFSWPVHTNINTALHKIST